MRWVIRRPFDRVNQNFHVDNTCIGWDYITVLLLCGYQSAEGVYFHVQGIRELVWKH
jgi:hypothetical protein